MFTGLVIGVGKVTAVRPLVGGIAGGGRTLDVRGPKEVFSQVRVGHSVAVSGVCLTATAARPRGASFGVSTETLERSTLGAAATGAKLNLELPLSASDRLGGHFVQGHVDGIGEVLAAGGDAADYRLAIRHPQAGPIVSKGSVAVDGVSLTVARVLAADRFEVMLIPHTRSVTTLGDLRSGDRVNVEYDVLAKYVAALLQLPEQERVQPLPDR